MVLAFLCCSPGHVMETSVPLLVDTCVHVCAADCGVNQIVL